MADMARFGHKLYINMQVDYDIIEDTLLASSLKIFTSPINN